ncbi:hypothetical protein HMPREF0202_01463 [Cetobacterium somerae ATCC BAA-474]|uniref:Uncharacterized protein n=1 Tax=Cetobacterium somerae ATCC BAA-474 TaxID=1319815 RepID=U7VAW7_9FUSO|nr:hypothetical protein HMPREF0202_01463 [Cetobacterium somerae ATCC BAA-474]
MANKIYIINLEKMSRVYKEKLVFYSCLVYNLYVISKEYKKVGK